MRFGLTLLAAVFSAVVQAVDIAGPDFWKSVNPAGIEQWQRAQQAKAGLKCLRGVSVNPASGEVVVLAEASGHKADATVEFALIGPLSDRAYESLAVTVATPGDIARAIELSGCAAGRCIGGLKNQFWPYGNRFTVSFRELPCSDDAPYLPVSGLLAEHDPANSLLPSASVIFTGGRRGADGSYLADTNMPSSVFSLYNADDTIFDLPVVCGQSEAYGRIKTAKALKQGALIEFRFLPVRVDGGSYSAKKFTLEIASDDGALEFRLSGRGVATKGGADAVLNLLRAEAGKGYDVYLDAVFDSGLTVAQAAKAAALFAMLDGNGLRMDGTMNGRIYYQAFLPKERWRIREGRNPQPFELHLSRNASGALDRKLVFIGEDWSGEGLDPKLDVREYPFSDWKQLPQLVEKTGGRDNKVLVLFVFAPANAKLSEFEEGLRLVAERLPMVHVFSE